MYEETVLKYNLDDLNKLIIEEWENL
jgi:hypothetical protein